MNNLKSIVSRNKAFQALKGVSLFFLGLLGVVVVTRAFEVVPVANNAIGYMKSMIFTASGTTTSATGIVLNGVNGDAYFKGNIGIGVDPDPNFALKIAGNVKYLGTFDYSGSLVVQDTIQSKTGMFHTLLVQNLSGNTMINATQSNKIILDENNVARVGIGTPNPDIGIKLDVAGVGRFSSGLSVSAGGATINGSDVVVNGGTQAGKLRILGSGTSTLHFGSRDESNPRFISAAHNGGNINFTYHYGIANYITPLSITTGGNVGIGTSSPAYKFDVTGTGRFLNALCIGSGLPEDICIGDWRDLVGLFGLGSQWITVGSDLVYTGGNVGIGMENPIYKLHVAGSSRFDGNTIFNGNIMFSFDGTDGFILENSQSSTNAFRYDHTNILLFEDNDGSVAIGKATPTAKLDVAGTGKFNGLCLGASCISAWPTAGAEGDSLWMTGANGLLRPIDTSRTRFQVGSGVVAGGTSSFAAGENTKANGNYSVAMGATNTGAGNSSVAMGQGNNVGGDFSVAMGYNNNANQAYSFVVGGNNDIWSPGGFSVIMGQSNQIRPNADYGVAIGQNNIAWNDFGVAIGYSNDAYGRYNFIVGHGNTTSGDFGMAIGFNLSKIHGSSNGGLAVGYYNEDIPDSVFEIGYGSSVTRKNALTVHSNGVIEFPGDVLSTEGDISIVGGNLGVGINVNSYAGAGSVYASAYYYSSDKRLKTDLKSIDDPLQKILGLNGYLFTWKKNGKKDMGIIAQEVEKVFPEIVSNDAQGNKLVEYANLVAPLIESIKELNQKIETQQKEIQSLKKLIKK